MKIFLGADHRGFQLKNILKESLEAQGYQVFDVGNLVHDEGDDFTDFSASVARSVVAEDGSRGVFICGSGVGGCIAANKITGIRCGLAYSVKQVAAARNDDDINMVALPADYISEADARLMTEAFLQTPFSKLERYTRRIEKIASLEQESCSK
jgi:ribose 5-phosphate isomerase B